MKRSIYFTISIYSLIVFSPQAMFGATNEATSNTLQQWISKAGNMEEDRARLEYLKQIRSQSGLDTQLKADLDKLIEEIERFITSPKLDYFNTPIYKKHEWDFGISADSPLFPLTYLYHARMLIWCVMEHGSLWSIPENRRVVLDKAIELLEKAKTEFPDNRIIRMYLGEPIPAPIYQPNPPEAPEWAKYQRDSLERLADIIEWWVDNRLQNNGEYGGGWGDDCEMWRWWVPVLIGFESEKIDRAQARFSRALMAQPHMKDGYSSHLSDVEHSSEDSADAITPMMHLEPDNPEWCDITFRILYLMGNLWMGKNEQGFLQFKSIDFSSKKVNTEPKRACDTAYHPRVAQPALLYWQRTGDPRFHRLFTQWMDTWADAAKRSERGKPAGIVPSAIHWPDGAIGGLSKNWWDPEEERGGASLYRWPGAVSMLYHSLLLAYHMTGDNKYFEPIRSTAEIRRRYLKNKSNQTPDPGSELWCGSKINLTSVLAKYRLLSGDDGFDDLLSGSGNSYLQFRLNENRAPLIRAIGNTAKAFGINFPGYTNEVRYTDRVLRFPTLFRAGVMFSESIPNIHTPNPALLYSMVTGDPGGAGYFPLNRVRWLTPPRGIAALVTDTATDRLQAELFHFGSKPRDMGAELYLFEPGDYTCSIGTTDTSDVSKTQFVVDKPSVKINFQLPPQQVVILRIERLKK